MLKLLQGNLRTMFVLTVLLFSINTMWGQTYTYTFGAIQYNASPQAKTLNGVSWTLTNDGGYYNTYDATKGQQIGSSGNPANNMTLSTSGISGTITSVKIYTSGAASVAATVSASVGGTAYGNPTTITASNTGYTFTGNSSGQIVFTWNQSSSKALYIKQIEVTYSTVTTYTLAYNANTGSGTAPTGGNYQAAASFTTATQGSLTKTGYNFTGWNSTADGSGTSYATNTSYSMPASNLTLYAQWALNNTPTLTASPSSLSGFNYVNNNGPSTSQSFNLSGTVLTGAPGNISVSGSSSYEVSLSPATNFGASVNVAYNTATLSTTPVYIRLKAGLGANTYNGETINISGGGATASVTANGSVSNQAPTASALAVTGNNFNVGTQLTGSFTYSDYEGNPQGTSTYKWYTATDNTGSGSAAISGATATTLTPTTAQLGKYIQYSVTPVATAGTTTGVETKSSWYGPIVAPSLAITGTTNNGTSCVGTAATAVTYTITNNGTATATGVTVTSSNTNEFVVSALSSTTIAAGSSATFTVTFTASASGNRTATLTPVSTTTGTIATLAISGTGSVAAIATVGNSAGASSTGSTTATVSGTATINACSSAITSYGIYYSTTYGFSNGTGTQVLGSNLSNGAFTVVIPNLTPNTTYYYKAFAINGSGTAYSGQNAFTTGTYTVNAPVAKTATNITPNSFNANWNAESTATDYRIDVATTSGFAQTIISEDFSTFVAGATSTNVANPNYSNYANYFNTTGWTGTVVYDAEVGFPRIGSGSGPGSLITPTLDLSVNGGTTTLTFDVRRYNNDSSKITVSYSSNNGSTYAPLASNITLSPDFTTLTYTITGGTATSKIKIENLAKDQRFNVDNLSVSYSTVLPSYNNVSVSTLTKLVSGLTENTTYYYRVRGVHSTYNVTSANSDPIAVTTGKNLIWNTNQWTAGATPRPIDNGTIETAYTNPASGLSIGNLTVNSGVTVDVPANTTITVGGNLVNNNATGANFIVHDNGALVQTGTGTNTGAVTVLKDSNPLYRQDYTMWAAPVENQKLIDFSPATLATRFYEYRYGTNAQNQNIEGYWPVDVTNTFSAAKGYLIRMPNADATPGYNAGTASLTFKGEFIGKPHTGNYNITASTAANRFTAVGNPYPSPIGVEEFYEQNSDVLDSGATIFLWRKRNSTTQSSSYAKLTRSMFIANGSSTATNGNPTGGQDQNQYFASGRTFMLAPGQGFIVQTKNGATGTDIKFTNSMRKAAPTTGGQAFLRTAQTPASRMWINIAGPDGGFSQSGIAYMAGATTGLDYGYDGKQLIEQGIVSLYTLAENTALAIQARPEFTTSDVVPMGYSANIAGNFTISIDHSDGLFATGQNVYLKDKAMGITRNISETDYTFTTEAGKFEDRFELVYTTAALGTDNPVATADNLIVYKNGESVNINAGSTRINAVTVFDIRGRKLYSQQNVNNTEAVVNGLTVQSQVLIIEIATEKGTVSKKIIF